MTLDREKQRGLERARMLRVVAALLAVIIVIAAAIVALYAVTMLQDRMDKALGVLAALGVGMLGGLIWSAAELLAVTFNLVSDLHDTQSESSHADRP